MSVLAVPSELLCIVLRALPRDATLRLRLACRAMCERVSSLVAGREVGFRRSLRVDGPSWDVAWQMPTVRSLLARFAPAVAVCRAWEIRVDAARFLALAAALHQLAAGAEGAAGCFHVALVYPGGGTYPLRELAAALAPGASPGGGAGGGAAFRCLTRLDLVHKGFMPADGTRLVCAIARLGGLRRLTSLDITHADLSGTKSAAGPRGAEGAGWGVRRGPHVAPAGVDGRHARCRRH
jgi:hypothetical protein